MAVRKVELRLTSSGFEEAIANLDKLSAKIDEIKAKFDELGKKSVTPRVDLTGIAEAKAQLDDLDLKLTDIGKRDVTARVKVKVKEDEVGKTFAESLKKLLERASAGESASGGGGFFKGLFSRSIEKDIENNLENDIAGGGGGGGGIGKDALSSLGGASNYLTGGAIGGLVAWAASLTPALLPFALGSGVGLGGILGALKLGSTAHTNLQSLEANLKGTTGTQRTKLLDQISTYKQRYAPELGLYNSATNLGHDALKTFNEALTGKGKGGTSFISGLAPIFDQIGKFIKGEGPQLGKLFRDSLPFVRAFVKIMEQFAKAVMPAVDQVMKQLTPYLPQIEQGFKYLSQGIADFIKDLGPGIRTSVTVFKASMLLVKGLMIGLAYIADALAFAFARFGNNVRKTAHQVAEAWDAMRHVAAAAFDWIVNRIKQDTDHITNNLDHWRHDIAALFGRLPGMLKTLAIHAMEGLLGGFIQEGNKVLGWVGHFVSSIPGKFMSLLGIHSPSTVMRDIGANTMQGLINGLNGHSPKLKKAIDSLSNLISKEFKTDLYPGEGSWLTSFLQKDNKTLAEVTANRKKILKTLQEAQNFKNTTKGTIVGAYDITSITNAAGGAPSAGDIAHNLSLDLSQVKTFAANIKKLVKMGLNRKLLRQIIAAGPINGAAAAAALADTSEASIRNINHEEQQITSLGAQVGRIGAGALYFKSGNTSEKTLREEIHVVFKAEGNDALVKALVRALRYEIREKGGGNVQKHLGWGKV